MPDPITCTVTKWYYKRMLLMSLMLLAFAAYFFYDGAVGYPKKNAIYREHKRFEEVMNLRAKFLNEGGSKAEWETLAKEKAYPEETDWKSYAAKRGWGEKPPEKEYGTTDQYVCGGLLATIGLSVLGTFLKNRGQKVRADEAAYYTPKGERIAFASAYQIDTRKWDNKGLGYVRYRDEAGKEKRATLDDLKFGGVDRILARWLENFEGELIERVAKEPATEEVASAKADEPAA